MLSMRVRDLIAAPKVVTKAGEWKSGKMTRTAFPMSRTRNFQLGARWSWRVDLVDAGGVECRLLTAFEPSKHGFLAWLTCRRGDAHVMLARLEYHGSEPGIHCHASCDEVHNVQVGVVKPYPTTRLPKYCAFHRRSTYEMTEASALAVSFEFFNVKKAPQGALV